MKKLFLIIISVIMAVSCGVARQDVDRQTIVMFQDFRPFAEQGFLLTPNNYTGEYSACGLLEINVFPAKKANNTAGKTNEYGNYEIGSSYVTVEKITSEELITIAVEKAKELGADAICNFQCVSHYNSYINTNGHLREEFSHYKISGFCIKRAE